MLKKFAAVFIAAAICLGQGPVWPAPFYSKAVTSAVNVTGAAASVWGYVTYNPNASGCVLDFFNTAPTLGTTVPIMSVGMGATSPASTPPLAVLVNSQTGLWVAGVTAAGGNSTCSSGIVATIIYHP